MRAVEKLKAALKHETKTIIVGHSPHDLYVDKAYTSVNRIALVFRLPCGEVALNNFDTK